MVKSGGTSWTRTLTLPVLCSFRSYTTRYWASAGRVTGSTQPPVIVIVFLAPTSVPLSRSIHTEPAQHTGSTVIATRWPAIPAKVNAAFWPGVVVVAVALAPPGTTASVTSGGTSNRRSVAEPVAVPWGSIRIVYVPVAASVLVSTNSPLVPKAARGASRVPSGFLIDT